MIYKLEIEKGGANGYWYVMADSIIEAMVRTLSLGVNVLGWSFA